ncbi:MAG: DoxX family membrane protein [Myxococcales bacterium]|nr:DoxX family membrane protein [Myxococcales bacterium]
MESRFAQIGWAIVRVVFGLSMAFFHGYGKVFEGRTAGLARTVAELGLPAPSFLAWLAALAELGGGLLVALGLATRYAAASVCAVMLVALYRHLPEGIAKMELAALYLSVMLMAVAAGGGRYSLDTFARLQLPISRKG